MAILQAQGAASRFELDEYMRAEFEEHRRAFEDTVRSVGTAFAGVLQLWENAVRQGGKLLLFGNGGSASDAQHVAAELVVRYKSNRPAIAAIALSTDTSALTACSNDLGFEHVFARQIEALARPGDVAVGISTSGRSPNVLAGLREARNHKISTTGFAGGDGGMMSSLCDELIVVPSSVTARIQEMHITIAHMLCKALEIRLGLV